MRSPHWIAVFVAISLFLVGYCLLAPLALPKLWQMRHKEGSLRGEIASLKKQVQKLNLEASLLSGDTRDSLEYLEYVARKEHGFIGHGELLLLLNEPLGKKANHEKNIYP